MLYGSSKIWLNNLSQTQLCQLKKLAVLSRDLYNISIKTVSEQYVKTNTILDFQQLKALIKDSDEYVTITGFFYAIMISAISDFKKYINTNSYAKNKSKHTLEVKNLIDFRPPLPKPDYFPIMILKVSIYNDYIIIPKTKITEEIKIKLPNNYINKSISKVTIRPLFGFSLWQCIIDYSVDILTHHNLDKNKALGIDLGISNFATCGDTIGNCFILDGRYLKSILQGYCKYKGKLSSASSNRHNTRRLVSLHKKTFSRVEDYIRKCSSYIIKHCIKNNIGHLVIGWGVHMQNYQLGRSNQMFALFPFARFKNLLFFKCAQNGIDFKTTDECYTSIASFIDLDPMPQHITREKQFFSGKRRYRGLYVSKDGIKINSDVNGAYNILRKSKCNAVINFNLGDRGNALTPMRINPLKL